MADEQSRLLAGTNLEVKQHSGDSHSTHIKGHDVKLDQTATIQPSAYGTPVNSLAQGTTATVISSADPAVLQETDDQRKQREKEHEKYAKDTAKLLGSHEKDIQKKAEDFRKNNEKEADNIRKELEKHHEQDVKFRKEVLEATAKAQKEKIDLDAKHLKNQIDHEVELAKAALDEAAKRTSTQVVMDTIAGSTVSTASTTLARETMPLIHDHTRSSEDVHQADKERKSLGEKIKSAILPGHHKDKDDNASS